MKKVYLIHGWSGSPTSEPWFEWLGNECKKRNYKLTALEMPNTEHPKIEEWVKYMEENIKI